MRSEEEASRAIALYGDTVKRICILLKSFFRSRTLPLDSIIEKPGEPDSDYSDVLEAVLSLPQKYKDVVYLYYYEEYSAAEISRILHKNVNTVYTLLNRGRQALKTKLEEVDEHGK